MILVRGSISVRVSGDGSVLVFESELGLTGYDNAPAEAGLCEGELCREVYLFDAVSGRLVCLSCGVGSRPVGPARLVGMNRWVSVIWGNRRLFMLRVMFLKVVGGCSFRVLWACAAGY